MVSGNKTNDSRVVSNRAEVAFFKGNGVWKTSLQLTKPVTAM